MFNIVKKQGEIITALHSNVNTLEEAKNLLEQEAVKSGGKFDTLPEGGGGIQLVRKDNTIQEFKKSVKVQTRSMFTRWALSPTKEEVSELVAEYSIVGPSSQQEENTKQTTEVAMENKETKQTEIASENKEPTKELTKDESNEKSKNDLMKIVLTIDYEGILKVGLLNPTENVNVQSCSLNDIRQKVLDIHEMLSKNGKYDKVDLKILGKIFTNHIINNDDNLILVENKSSGIKSGSKLKLKPAAPCENHNVHLATKLVKLLSPERRNDYVFWMYVNYALHNIDESLYGCFIEFSQEVYSEEECNAAWNCRDNDFDIVNLHNWANKDSPNSYAKLMGKQ